ncbi:hypothetical protein DLNHIDIE_02970 [Acidithiobacillus thiooxidans ATCC 19377]|uniref:Uncharacterized protein n=1 Tax=Acidithiobacillus thiooxidans ATCC 19377 TaxID=637390 RepID=A0A543PZR4_ACITH|nr:hypothetical protein DLNHIDIE_02970 [Acidithiobacillus thiooxidans ATCC 19377]
MRSLGGCAHIGTKISWFCAIWTSLVLDQESAANGWDAAGCYREISAVCLYHKYTINFLFYLIKYLNKWRHQGFLWVSMGAFQGLAYSLLQTNQFRFGGSHDELDQIADVKNQQDVMFLS